MPNRFNIKGTVFSSFRVKIIFFIALIMIATAGLIMHFSNQDVAQAMFVAQQQAAKDVLRFIELNINSAYDRQLKDRVEAMFACRGRLKDQARRARSIVVELAGLVDRNILTRAQAQQKAETWLQRIPHECNQLFVFDSRETILIHSDARLIGQSAASMVNLNGKSIGRLMQARHLPAAGDFSVFTWKDNQRRDKRQRLGYFIPFFGWGWTLVAAIDIDDIETDMRRQQNAIVDMLRNTLQKHQTRGETAFLFNGQKQILIAPTAGNGPCEASVNDQTAAACSRIMDRAMAAAHSDAPSLRYREPGASDREMIAFAAYYRSLDWYIVIAGPFETIEKPALSLVKRQSYIIGSIFIVSLLMVFFLIDRLFAPLKRLSAYAMALPDHDFSAPDNHDAEMMLPIADQTDEIGRLANSFQFMQTRLHVNIQQLMATTASRERMKSELNVARKIQMGILPKTFPPFPDIPDLDIYAMIEPAKEVGGDLYDFFFLDDDHLCFCLGDVSDKGVPAALFMVITRTLVKMLAENERSPARIMEQINDILSADNPKTMFVTLIIGILNIRTGHLNWANGGHNPPILADCKGQTRFIKQFSGMVVGAMESIQYIELSLRMRPGDCLLLYTDGVTEAMNAGRQLFGDQRLLATAGRIAKAPVKTGIHDIMEAIHRFVGHAPQSDDIAMMTIRFNGHG